MVVGGAGDQRKIHTGMFRENSAFDAQHNGPIELWGVGFTQGRGHFSLPVDFQLFDKAPKPKGNTSATHCV